MTDKPISVIHRCGICNHVIEDGESWTETDCIICEACSELAGEEIILEVD